MTYRHVQVGRFLIVVLALSAVALAVGGYASGFGPVALVPAALMVVTLAAFARLTIEVDRDGVRWAMSFGFPGSFVAFADVESVQIVPITFWYGIGIHLTLRGWVWNVALGRGVQIARRGALPLVLGTDDPEGLLAAIERARAA